MPVRVLKAVFAAWISLLCVFYAAQNVANLDAAHAAVAYVFSMQDHAIYGASFGPSVTHPALVWTALVIIIALEFAAGLCAARGAWDLWRARRADARTYHAAKTYALVGAGLGLFVWFGLFSVVGGAYFQMWQTGAGGASLTGAFQYLGMNAFVLIFINMRDDELLASD